MKHSLFISLLLLISNSNLLTNSQSPLPQDTLTAEEEKELRKIQQRLDEEIEQEEEIKRFKATLHDTSYAGLPLYKQFQDASSKGDIQEIRQCVEKLISAKETRTHACITDMIDTLCRSQCSEKECAELVASIINETGWLYKKSKVLFNGLPIYTACTFNKPSIIKVLLSADICVEVDEATIQEAALKCPECLAYLSGKVSEETLGNVLRNERCMEEHELAIYKSKNSVDKESALKAYYRHRKARMRLEDKLNNRKSFRSSSLSW